MGAHLFSILIKKLTKMIFGRCEIPMANYSFSVSKQSKLAQGCRSKCVHDSSWELLLAAGILAIWLPEQMCM